MVARRLLCVEALIGLLASAICGQNAPSLRLNLPNDTPVLLESFDVGTGAQHQRGFPGAGRFDAALKLRNIASKTIVGIVFTINYDALGHLPAASVITTGLHVPPAAEFPLHMSLQTAQGTRMALNSPASLNVSLDCVLFSDLSFYGSDPLHERDNLIVYELQARRERSYVGELIKADRLPEVREELNFGLPPEPPAWVLTLAAEPKVVRGKTLTLQPLVEDSPVQMSSGTIQVNGGRFWGPEFEVHVRATPVVPSSVDVALIIADQRGREAVAAILPFTLNGAKGESTVRCSLAGEASALDSVPVLIRKCYAFISDIKFVDGSVWIPGRADLEKASDGSLLSALASCPERQRLADVFRRGGIEAVMSDLKQFD